MKKLLIIAVIINAVVATALALASGFNNLAQRYFDESYFTYGSHVAVLGEPNYKPQRMADADARPATPAGVPRDVEKEVVNKAGVRGRVLGTYVYNSTHYVTLVEAAPLDVSAVIWNNRTLAVGQLRFEKYIEGSGNKTLLRDGNYTYLVGWLYAGYRDVSGVLPFSVMTFYDENWGQWNTPTGYFKVAAAGWFTVVYGAAVYVSDSSYYVVTDPVLKLCTFTSSASGSGTPQASVRAYGKAITLTCYTGPATVFDITAVIGYDAWLNRFAPPPTGNKWLTVGCQC
ncbi:MAG: hypothetical protein QXI84_11445 [Thermofilaceae archaeon]